MFDNNGEWIGSEAEWQASQEDWQEYAAWCAAQQPQEPPDQEEPAPAPAQTNDDPPF